MLDRVRLVDPKSTAVRDARIPLETKLLHEDVTEKMPAGTVRVPSDQPLGLLAAALLEPESQDSFLAWGFFPEILAGTSGAEDFVQAPIADALLKADPHIRAAFEAKLATDAAFAADGDRRLKWLSAWLPECNPYHHVYPVRRETR